MAAYAAQASLRAIVLLPEGKVAAGKLAQAIAYRAEIRHVPGDFDRAMVDVERMCLDQGIYLLNSLKPFRLSANNRWPSIYCNSYIGMPLIRLRCLPVTLAIPWHQVWVCFAHTDWV